MEELISVHERHMEEHSMLDHQNLEIIVCTKDLRHVMLWIAEQSQSSAISKSEGDQCGHTRAVAGQNRESMHGRWEDSIS